jgi:hypothetical protein
MWQLIMKRDTHFHHWFKQLATATIALALLGMATKAGALTLVQFAPVQTQLTNEIAALQTEPNPTKQQQLRLRTLLRAESLLTNSATDDGKALRALSAALRGSRYSDYAPALELTRSNLVYTLNNNFCFVCNLVNEIPPSNDAAGAQAQIDAFAPRLAKLNNVTKLTQAAGLLDPARRQIIALQEFITQELIVPFPAELERNMVMARINGVNFRVAESLATDNVFVAQRTENGIDLSITAVDGTPVPNAGVRSVVLSLPNINENTFRYNLPGAATLINRTGVYSGNESASAATNGAIFVATRGDEVFGVFIAFGDDLRITQGRFRVDITPAAE